MATFETIARRFCCRCGERYDSCLHVNCTTTLDEAHALRIRARYAIGKKFNVDHDTADYTDAAPVKESAL